MRIQQKVVSNERIRKWKTGLIGQADRSKVVYLTAGPNAAAFKDRCPLVYCMLRNVTKLFKRYDWLIC